MKVRSEQVLKENIERWNYAVEQKINIGNLGPIDNTYAEDYLYHGMGQSESSGTEIMKQSMKNLRAGFSDISIKNDLFGAGDRAVNHFQISGTHDGEWAGIAPTGRKICFSGIAISRFKEGRIIEEWEFCDEMTLLRQLGAFDSGEQPRSILELVKQLSSGITSINKVLFK